MVDENLSRYLWKGLDLERYSVVKIIPQDETNAVIIMYSNDPNDPHWCMEYMGGGHYFDTAKQLLGHPVYVCRALDDVAPDSIPVLFGDFSYFWIGDRGKRVIKRLVERYADRGQVAFITSERVDAKLVLSEAVKMLKVKSA